VARDFTITELASPGGIGPSVIAGISITAIDADEGHPSDLVADGADGVAGGEEGVLEGDADGVGLGAALAGGEDSDGAVENGRNTDVQIGGQL
jgi:hypothetical protein